MTRSDIRIALPSKGALADGSLELLSDAGLRVRRPNPRQYQATIPALPGVQVIFQRPGDIVVGVRQGSLDFGITGYDIVAEKGSANGDQAVLLLHDALDYGHCALHLAAPEEAPVHDMAELRTWAQQLAENGRILRVATKFPHVTGEFLQQQAVEPVRLIDAEGTLEIAPAVGYAELIADLVSSGVTLRDNHLHPLVDGQILASQAVLIANRRALSEQEDVRAVARQLLEYIEAHLRAQGSYLVIANIRGESPHSIAQKMAGRPHIGGLQGPTVAPVIPPQGSSEQWFSISIVIRKANLVPAIAELRAIGGSGVIAAPLAYIFEEEPARYAAMLAALNKASL